MNLPETAEKIEQIQSRMQTGCQLIRHPQTYDNYKILRALSQPLRRLIKTVAPVYHADRAFGQVFRRKGCGKPILKKSCEHSLFMTRKEIWVNPPF
jgi:hypothetical protein